MPSRRFLRLKPQKRAAILREAIALEKQEVRKGNREIREDKRERRHERFQLFLALGFFCLLLRQAIRPYARTLAALVLLGAFVLWAILKIKRTLLAQRAAPDGRSAA